MVLFLVDEWSPVKDVDGGVIRWAFCVFFRCVQELKSVKEKNLFRRDCSDVYSVVIKCES